MKEIKENIYKHHQLISEPITNQLNPTISAENVDFIMLNEKNIQKFIALLRDKKYMGMLPMIYKPSLNSFVKLE